MQGESKNVITGKRTQRDWLLAHVGHQGSDCLIWPFWCDPLFGRAVLGGKGKSHWASRVMCEEAHGAPPTRRHQAAHSCGRGHEGCINPRHLSWKTAQDNARDMVAHGTAKIKGPPRFKLTPEQVAEIRSLGGTMSQCAIAQQFGIGHHQVGKILRGQAWTGPARPKQRFPPEVRAEMCRTAATMRQGGSTFDEIATRLSVSRVTARHLAEQHASQS